MKRQLLLLVLVLMTVGVWAQQISEEQARDRALKFLTNNAPAKTRGLNVGIDRKTVTAKTDAKSIYAFNLVHCPCWATAPPAASTGTGCQTTCGHG